MHDTIKSISLKDLLFFAIGSILLSFLFGFTYYENWAGGVGASLYAINLSASIFTLGAPFVLGSIILIRSSQSMSAEDTQSKPYNVKFLTVSRYVVLMFLSSIFTLSWIVYSYFLAIQAYSHLSPDLIFTYLPGTLVSGFVMTVILCAITMFVVTVMGEWRLGAVGGFAFYYILGSSLGFSPHLFTWDSLAIFSPYHLYRFLAFAFSGHIDDPVMGIIWGDPGRMNMILGFNFGFPDILLSLALWTVFGFILLILVQYPLREDADFSMLEAKLNQFEKDDVHLLSKLEGIKTNLKRRRLALGMVLVLLLILLPIARTSTMFTFEEENTEILYQTPSGGVSLALGEWRYGEVDITSPPSGLNNMYQIHVVILAWGESPEELELWRILNPISISSFEAMNTTEKDELVHFRSMSITPDRTELGGGFSSIQTTGSHLWAIKFVPAEGYPIQGVMRIVITITLRAD